MGEPAEEEMVEVDPELARQAAIELYGLEAVEAAEAAFDEVCMAQTVIENRATA
jgi:hypothetical protein